MSLYFCANCSSVLLIVYSAVSSFVGVQRYITVIIIFLIIKCESVAFLRVRSIECCYVPVVSCFNGVCLTDSVPNCLFRGKGRILCKMPFVSWMLRNGIVFVSPSCVPRMQNFFAGNPGLSEALFQACSRPKHSFPRLTYCQKYLPL